MTTQESTWNKLSSRQAWNPLSSKQEGQRTPNNWDLILNQTQEQGIGSDEFLNKVSYIFLWIYLQPRVKWGLEV